MKEPQCPITDRLDQLNREIEGLSELVITDALTGLYNLRHLRFCLEQEMERTQRSGQSCTLILLDIDHFKAFNDTHGHVVGDSVLRHVAQLLKSAVRKIDIPCRYGGEEFAVLLPSTPLLIGAKVAERIRETIAGNPMGDGENSLTVTISAGVDAFNRNDESTPEIFIQRADACLYQAKDAGRNRVVHAAPEISRDVAVSQDERDALFGPDPQK